MYRKKWFTVTSLLIVILILAACSSNEDSSKADGDDATIKVWALGEEGENLQSFAEDFEEEHSNITVDVQALPWDEAYKKFLTAVASGDGPDLLQVDTAWVAQFASAGMFEDLSSYKDDYPTFAEDNFFDGAVETMEYEDELVGIPWYSDTRLMFYRSDILGEAGSDKAPETWDDFTDVATKLADRGDKEYGAGIDQSNVNLPFILAWQHGWQLDPDDEYGNLDDEKFEEAFKLLMSFFDEGLAPTGKSMEPIVGFGKGVQPMMFSGPWTANVISDKLPDIDGDWDVALMPKNEDHTSVFGGSQLSVFKGSDNVEASVEFMSYLAEKDTQVEWFKENGNLPAVTDAWEDEVFAENEKTKIFKEQLETAQAIPQTEHWLKLIEASQRSIEKIKSGDANVDEGLEEFQEEAKKILSE